MCFSPPVINDEDFNYISLNSGSGLRSIIEFDLNLLDTLSRNELFKNSNIVLDVEAQIFLRMMNFMLLLALFKIQYKIVFLHLHLLIPLKAGKILLLNLKQVIPLIQILLFQGKLKIIKWEFLFRHFCRDIKMVYFNITS